MHEWNEEQESLANVKVSTKRATAVRV